MRQLASTRVLKGSKMLGPDGSGLYVEAFLQSTLHAVGGGCVSEYDSKLATLEMLQIALRPSIDFGSSSNKNHTDAIPYHHKQQWDEGFVFKAP